MYFLLFLVEQGRVFKLLTSQIFFIHSVGTKCANISANSVDGFTCVIS